MGDAWETIDKPAIVLMDIKALIAHHCHVLSAWPSVKSLLQRCESCVADGAHPSGVQPSGGFFMNAPAAMATMPYATPRYANVGINPTWRINQLAAGAEKNDPAPNPATAIPVMSPR